MVQNNNPPDDKYQELQQIYLKWHNGHRPLSGFIDELKAREARISDEARRDEVGNWIQIVSIYPNTSNILEPLHNKLSRRLEQLDEKLSN